MYYTTNNPQICYPSPQDKWMVADLWQDSFNDPPEYIDFFFNRIYNSENTPVIKRNGFIVSALQMIPYKLLLKGEKIPVSYICGACTHPFERGQGLMKTLIDFAKSELRSRGFEYAIVIPAEPSLFGYYRKLGFTKPLYHGVDHKIYNKFFIDSYKMNVNYTFEECTNAHFPYFERKLNERMSTILHDEGDFATILQEINCGGGKTFVALQKNDPVGIVFAEKKSKNSILIKDILTDNDEVFVALYYHALRYFNANHVKIHFPVNHYNEISEYGLLCDLNNHKSFFHFSMSLMHD